MAASTDSPAVDVPDTDGDDGGSFPAVLVFDDSTRSALYRRWLPDAIRVESVRSLEEAGRAVDESTGVALVRHELPESKRAAIATMIDGVSGQVRVVVTTADHSPVSDPVLDEDACLCEPVDRESLRTVVSRQLSMASYGRLLTEYYELSLRLASREYRRSSEPPSADDERIEARLSDLAAGIKTLQKRLTADEVRSVLHDIAPPEYERREAEREPPTSGKYRPDSCRSCGRDWNVAADGSPAGYRRLGAFVWECTDCGTLFEMSDPANQQVARRR
ncbi:hypothetical protein [Halosimplex sp. J119]